MQIDDSNEPNELYVQAQWTMGQRWMGEALRASSVQACD